MRIWLRRTMASIALATASVEKNAITQAGGSLADGLNVIQSKDQGSMLNDLKQGQVTQQVMELRARTYAVMEGAENIRSKGTPVLDENGNIIAMMADNKGSKNIETVPANIKGDPFDDYRIEMVVSNEATTLSIADTVDYFQTSNDDAREMSGDQAKLNAKYVEQFGGEDTQGGKAVEMTSGHELKNDEPIVVGRNIMSRFRIEQYTKKMFVRIVEKDTRLLEFYVSKYETEDKRSKFFLNTVKKFIKNPLNRELIEIDTVEFTTNKTVGKKDFRQYKYKVTGFNKIVEHNGFHIFKFNAEVTEDGTDILEEFKKDLSDEYKNKTARAPQSIGINPEDFYKDNKEFYDNIDDNKKKKD
tara:strand:- start:311 stop:1384 length:1074 start_codon:yes stop_codon:yes gene_type:complete